MASFPSDNSHTADVSYLASPGYLNPPNWWDCSKVMAVPQWQYVERCAHQHTQVVISGMLGTADWGTTDLGPIDTLIEGLVDQTNHADVVASHNVKAQNGLLTGIRVIGLANDALNTILQDL